ncbi:MAG: 2-dehydropantoate 2-reductase [Anaerolineaceae bacterium]|nr:2-dehydropantoate 2-reductase [Anaerolineaceae bacterium]
MRFLCFGVGAIGTYLGGSLALANQIVVFLDRPETVAAVRQTGLRLRLNDGEHVIERPDVVGSIEEALTHGPFDAAIVAVKSFDTPGLVHSLAPYHVALPPVLCFQNGVENESVLASVFGNAKVIACTLTSAIGRRGPGDIALERLRGVGVVSSHVLVPTLVSIFNAAGLEASPYQNAAKMKWSKMLTNLMTNASAAILDMTPAEIVAHPGLFHLEMRQMRETLAVMHAQKISAVDLPGTPVRALALLAQSFPEWISRPLLSGSVGKGRGEKMPSFHIDLHGKRGRSEVEYLNGAVVRYGESLGIPTPVNRALNEILTKLSSGDLPLSTYAHHPERLLAEIEAG